MPVGPAAVGEVGVEIAVDGLQRLAGVDPIEQERSDSSEARLELVVDGVLPEDARVADVGGDTIDDWGDVDDHGRVDSSDASLGKNAEDSVEIQLGEIFPAHPIAEERSLAKPHKWFMEHLHDPGTDRARPKAARRPRVR